MSVRALIVRCGSARATLACLGALALVVVARIVTGTVPAAALAVALAALALNLLAALLTQPAFRRQLPLLVAHLALLAVLLLAAGGRLAALAGRFELTQGEPFDGELIDGEAGPWYRGDLRAIAFTYRDFAIDYAPGLQRGATRNTVSWIDARGARRQAVIGDHHPLRLDGYRIYTTPNKGFAPVLSWLPTGGAAVRGAVHLPSYPAQALRQSREWRLPDGRGVWLLLQFDGELIDRGAPARFRMPAQHALIVRAGDQRAVLRPGAAMALDGGVLRYEELRTWMGYRVTRDPTLPWLVAAALLAAGAFGWHYFGGAWRPRAAAPAGSPALARALQP